jgi:hypothetical protein
MANDCHVLYLSFTLLPSASGGPTVIVLIIILIVILYPGIAKFPFPKDFEQIQASNL